MPVEPIVGITVFDRLGNNLFGMNSYLSGDNVNCGEKKVVYCCEFQMPELNEGVYTVSPAFADGNQANHVMRHWVYDACHFYVISRFTNTLPGILAPQDFRFSVEIT